MGENKKKKNIFKEYILPILISAIIVVTIFLFFKPTLVKETSMVPTLQNNNLLILSQVAYVVDEPEYGDIIVFDSGLKLNALMSKLYIKRIIGKGGDTIKIDGQKVYRNGELLEEPYINTHNPNSSAYDEDLQLEVTVPSGEYFVMGDNRDVSMDSRCEEIGTVSRDDIVGKAYFRVFPNPGNICLPETDE